MIICIFFKLVGYLILIQVEVVGQFGNFIFDIGFSKFILNVCYYFGGWLVLNIVGMSMIGVIKDFWEVIVRDFIIDFL